MSDKSKAVYGTPTMSDFQRNLDMTIMHGVQQEARTERVRITSEFASRGMGQSTSLIAAVVGRFDTLHKDALERAMNLIHEFCNGGGGLSLTALTDMTRYRFENLATMLLAVVPPAGFPQEVQRFRNQYAAVFRQRLDGALRDIEIGFIGGRAMTDSQTSQSRALRLLKGIYDRTRDQTEPVFVEDLAQSANLTREESQAGWRYLRDSNLIQTFSIPGTARINAAGINAIEDAQRHPDRPAHGFPSVTYNIVNNTANIGTAINSTVQQAGAQSKQTSHSVGRAFTVDTAEHIQAATPLLNRMSAMLAVFCAVLFVAGIAFILMNVTGYTEISLFGGNSIKSSNIGLICLFLSVVIFGLNFRRILTSVERLGRM